MTLARFSAQKSELEVAERWYADSVRWRICWASHGNGSMMRGSIAA